MSSQPVTFFCRFCYASNKTLYPVRLYCLSLTDGLIMCANQSCSGLISGQVDLLRLVIPITSETELTYQQYQQTPYYSTEFELVMGEIPLE